MRARGLLSVFSAVVLAATFGVAMVACSGQGEAERCSKDTNGDDDCQDGLTCVNRSDISSTICCPPTGGSTPECRNELIAPNDSAPPETAVAKDTAVIADGALGFGCVFDSDCDSTLRCRLGRCNYECAGDRDCQDEFTDKAFCDVCGDHQCHATFKPEFTGSKDEAGVCVPADAGVDGGDGASDATDASSDDSTDDASTTDATTIDSTLGDAAVE